MAGTDASTISREQFEFLLAGIETTLMKTTKDIQKTTAFFLC